MSTLFLLSSQAQLPTAFTANTVFVDGIYGNDATGLRERRDFPFRTIAAGIAAASPGDTIEIFSDLTFSGGVTVSLANLSINGHNHKITSAGQTDTRKLTVSADKVTIRNLEINGTWDGSSSGTTTGSAIFLYGKSITLDNLNIHDVQDLAVYSNVSDFTDLRIRSVQTNNTKGGAISLIASTTGTVTNVNLQFVRVTNVIGGGQGLAILNNSSSGYIVGVNISHFFIDNVGAFEAIYAHQLRDFAISNGETSNSKFNISLDTCDHGAVTNVTARGGRTDQYSGIEIAWGRWISVSNSVFDGVSRSGTLNTTDSAGIVASTFATFSNAAGPISVSGVVSHNWNRAISMSSVYGINISGSSLKGSFAAISLAACGNVQVTGNYLEAYGSDGFDKPIFIDSGAASNDTAYSSVGLNRFFVIGNNQFKASTGCDTEIGLLSQDANDTLANITVKENVRQDSVSFADTAVKQTANAGGSLSNVAIRGNEPPANWPDVDYSNKLGINTGTPPAGVNIDTVSDYHLDAVHRLRPDQSASYAVDIGAGYSNARNFRITVHGATPDTDLVTAPQDGSQINLVPTQFKHLADSTAPNDTTYYSTTSSKLVYKDPSGTVHPLY